MNRQFYLGCSGYYYDHWKNLFYPSNLAKKKWLEFYSQYFNTLEVNSTFYRFPKQSMLQNWHQQTPEDFKFILKANRLITHSRKFNETKELIDRFYAAAKFLNEKLSCVLFQLPPFVNKNMELLEKIANQVDPSITNVLEFRHESWWDKEVYSFMEKNGLVFCSVSASDLPDYLVKNASIVYIRFHGKNGWYKHFYPDEELEGWTQKINKIKSKQVYCYFNNDYNANAVKNCQTLRNFLGLGLTRRSIAMQTK